MTVPLYVSGSSGTRRRVKQNKLAQLASSLTLPAAVAAFAIYRYVRSKRGKKEQPKPSQPAEEKPAKQKAKPRRDYKIRQGGSNGLPAAASRGQEAVDEHEDDEEEEANPGPGQKLQLGPGQGQNFVSMLQSLGYRLVVPNDGSGQAYLVPPGAKVPGEGDEEGGMIEEGDEEGYDEDEDAEEVEVEA